MLTEVQKIELSNQIVTDDSYSRLFVETVKAIKKNPTTEAFSILAGSGGNSLVLNGRGYSIGHVATSADKSLINNFNLRFFLQQGAFSYSMYEVVCAKLSDLIPFGYKDMVVGKGFKAAIYNAFFKDACEFAEI
ncbi:MAG: hypothetical protein HAW67_01195 [Endozoicomonadaceae bacterium]|nr:hypothetical protein [Endozoicomonadaceae bacterium]